MTPFLVRVRDRELSANNEGYDWCLFLVYAKDDYEASRRAIARFIAYYVGDDREDNTSIEVEDLTIR